MMPRCIHHATRWSCRHLSDRALAWVTVCVLLLQLVPVNSHAQGRATEPQSVGREKVILDTDIGTDIDDAFALVLALRSPELEILGFSTASGDTSARAKIIDRVLGEAGYDSIPVVAGPSITATDKAGFAQVGLQRRYGENGRFVKASHRPALDFILEQIKRYPGQVTLVTIGPLTNVSALIDKDLATFRKIKRVVMMGGWIKPIVDSVGEVSAPTIAEYNIRVDIPSAQKLFRSGVPVYVAPLDSTRHLAFDEVKRRTVFSESSQLTDSLALLYLLANRLTPVLYDVVPLAVLVEPNLCPMEPMNIWVDDKGLTRVGDGVPNAHVCMRSDTNALLGYYMQRVGSTSRDNTRSSASHAIATVATSPSSHE